MKHVIDNATAQEAIERVVRTGYVSNDDEEALRAISRLLLEVEAYVPEVEKRLAMTQRLREHLDNKTIFQQRHGKRVVRLAVLDAKPAHNPWVEYRIIGVESQSMSSSGRDFESMFIAVSFPLRLHGDGTDTLYCCECESSFPGGEGGTRLHGPCPECKE